jgi:hypothetical protein
MSTAYGERHAKLLDQGLNVISILPPEDIAGIGSSYFGGGGGMLILEQSPHVLDAHSARLRILGAVAGGGMYGDENRLSFRLSSNVSLPNGTSVQLQETIERPAETIPRRLPNNALEVFGDVSGFVRTIAGNLHSTNLYGSTTSLSGVEAKISGIIKDDAMQEAYLRSIEGGVILGVQENPVSAASVPSIQYDVLTPGLNQVLTITMFDHRPGNREAMLALRDGS